jgi:hypothetical protein
VPIESTAAVAQPFSLRISGRSLTPSEIGTRPLMLMMSWVMASLPENIVVKLGWVGMLGA